MTIDALATDSLLVLISRPVFTDEVKWRLRLPLQSESGPTQTLFRGQKSASGKFRLALAIKVELTEIYAKIDEAQHANGHDAVHNEDNVSCSSEVLHDPLNDILSRFGCRDDAVFGAVARIDQREVSGIHKDSEHDGNGDVIQHVLCEAAPLGHEIYERQQLGSGKSRDRVGIELKLLHHFPRCFGHV